jgi:hypothetical protein
MNQQAYVKLPVTLDKLNLRTDLAKIKGSIAGPDE